MLEKDKTWGTLLKVLPNIARYQPCGVWIAQKTIRLQPSNEEANQWPLFVAIKVPTSKARKEESEERLHDVLKVPTISQNTFLTVSSKHHHRRGEV